MNFFDQQLATKTAAVLLRRPNNPPPPAPVPSSIAFIRLVGSLVYTFLFYICDARTRRGPSVG